MDTCRHEHEDSKSSSEDINQATDDDDKGTGRSYECVFCKRGFNTAQALGGHMNIHRKDRSKAKPSTPTRPHHEAEYYSNPSLFYSSNPNPTPQFSANFESRIGYDHMYFAAAASGSSRPHHGYQMDDSLVQSSRRLNPYQEDWFTSLSLHIGPGHVQDSIGKKGQGCKGTEEELDLELRLGHDP